MLGVGHRHAIHHDEGLAGAEDGLVASQDDLGGTAGTAGTGSDGDARHLALERVGEVGVLHAVQVRGAHLLGGVGERLLLAADAHGGDHHLLERIALGLHLHVELLLAIHGHLLCGVADVGEEKRGLRTGKLEVELTIHVRDGTIGVASFNDNAHTDEGLSVLIHNGTGDRSLLLHNSNLRRRCCLHVVCRQGRSEK